MIKRPNRIRFATILLLSVLGTGSGGTGGVPVTMAISARAVTGKISAQAYSRHPSDAALKWANRELKRMSLDEKIGQLVAVGLNATYLNQDSEAFKDLRHQIVDNHVGGVVPFPRPAYEFVMVVN